MMLLHFTVAFLASGATGAAVVEVPAPPAARGIDIDELFQAQDQAQELFLRTAEGVETVHADGYVDLDAASSSPSSDDAALVEDEDDLFEDARLYVEDQDHEEHHPSVVDKGDIVDHALTTQKSRNVSRSRGPLRVRDCVRKLYSLGWRIKTVGNSSVRARFRGSHLMLEHMHEPNAPTLPLPVHDHFVRADVLLNVLKVASDKEWLRNPALRRRRVHSPDSERRNADSEGGAASAKGMARDRSRSRRRGGEGRSLRERPWHVTQRMLENAQAGIQHGVSLHSASSGAAGLETLLHEGVHSPTRSRGDDLRLDLPHHLHQNLHSSAFLDSDFQENLENLRHRARAMEAKYALLQRENPEVADAELGVLVADIEAEMDLRCCSAGGSVEEGSSRIITEYSAETADVELALREIRGPLLYLQVAARAEQLREMVVLPPFPVLDASSTFESRGNSVWARCFWEQLVRNARLWRRKLRALFQSEAVGVVREEMGRPGPEVDTRTSGVCAPGIPPS